MTVPTEDLCREQIRKAPFYTCKRKYGGMEASHLKRLKELEEDWSVLHNPLFEITNSEALSPVLRTAC